MAGGITKGTFFVWRDGERLYALPLPAVLFASRMVEVTPAPDPVPGLLGLIDVRGRLTPVVSVAAWHGFASEPAFEDQLVIVGDGSHQAALLARELIGVVEDELTSTAELIPESRRVAGALRHNGAVVLLPDLGQLLRECRPAAAAGGS